VTKSLEALLAQIDHQLLRGDPEVVISGLAYDSRRVTGGELFACLPGQKTDGHDFIPEVLGKGAAAIMVQQGREAAAAEAPAAFSVPHPRPALAALAATYYDFPGKQLQLIGVTGTNGKSTTVHLINQLLRAAGLTTGLIGTLAYQLQEEIRPAPHTTPEAPDLQQLLAEMRERGLTHVSMEVSSHALHQYRADGCRFPVAVFTNLSRDHLDYHGNEAGYLAAKLRLFTEAGFLPEQGPRINVINIDDSAGRQIAAKARGQILSYGLTAEAQVRAQAVNLTAEYSEFELVTPQGAVRQRLPLLGRFNIYNALAAAAAGLALGLSPDHISRVLAQASAPTGRFQQIDSPRAKVIMDYAHTPDGLEKILATARDFCRGRLLVVFGCGGDRDPGKRPMMGEIASRLADTPIITSDNPRSEDPQKIIEQILAGIPKEDRDRCLVEPDRAKAIKLAIGQAEPEDVVVLAGKGHETYQIFADRTIHFDDREVAEAALAEKPAPSN
jgi:UDP-N-acetylmuramoyl-L-alanyl-D-glutamate--2,6-diaminopimelate ligase